ncbi:MAG TPA: hypothetical protein VN666_07105 [Nitrospira sp.]|nr:hypothetical protein [Nitrospira sp.]
MERETGLASRFRLAAEFTPTTKKRLQVRPRQPLTVVPMFNAVWAVDFMSDSLYGGCRFRTLNILDEGVCEGLE